MARQSNHYRRGSDDFLEKPSNNPFQSVYAAAFQAPKQNKSVQKHQEQRHQTPQKSAASKSISIKKFKDYSPDLKSTMHSSNGGIYTQRRFGQYAGPDGNPVQQILNTQEPRATDPIGLQTFTSGFNNSQYSNTSGTTRRNRCSDRFVRYPYPKNLISNYQKEYPGKLSNTKVQNHKDAFNIEKEHKIINPHAMDKDTVQKTSYKGFQVQPSEKKMRQAPKNDAPMQQQSSYQAGFPNWKNGQQDIYHEKHPQYPYYSLPFKGNSNYKQNFTEEKMRELKRQQELLSKVGADGQTIRLSSYEPKQFDFITTNQKEYQGFTVATRPKSSKPKAYAAVKTKAFPQHFDTFNKKEFVKHQYQVPEVDLIPYP